MLMEQTKILLFGGSYNPIHKGHINAALNASNYLQCQEVWFIPRKYNYDGSLLLDGKHRIAMMKMALAEFPNFKICDIELKDRNKKLIYTYNTARLLTKKYKNQYQFYFLIGADQLNNIERWYKIDQLTKLFQFVCFKRPGYIINEKLAQKYHVLIIDGKQIDASSTKVRAGYYDEIDESIQQYIKEHELYLKERLMPHLPERLFIHCLSTARLAKALAQKNQQNTNRAYVAGILHDVSKALPKDEIRQIMEQHFPTKLKKPEYCHHQYASAYLAKTIYGISDVKTLKAIASHCRSSKKMSKLDKIIYCADKLEEEREFANAVADIRKEAYQNIDKAFIWTMEDQYRYLKNNQKWIDPWLVLMIDYYKRKEKDNGR